MNALIIGVAIILLALLIFKSLKNRSPEAEQCAREVIKLLRVNRNASIEELADEIRRNLADPSHLDQAVVYIKARLSQAHIPKEDQQEVMRRVREAKQIVRS